MREVSGHGIRVLLRRGCVFALLALAMLGRDASAQAITRFVRDTGNINFVTTGGSLRAQDNTGNSCLMNATSSQNLSGIPGGTTIRNAYLYWGGSGSTADTSVTLNGSTVTASRTFARTWVNGGTNYPFFGGFANVTALVTGNGNYTLGNLTVNTGAPFNVNSTCAGGWALVVVYQGEAERLRAINIFDGLDYFYGSQLTLNPDGFRVPPINIDGRIGVFTLDGDPANSTSNNGFDEALRFNGTLLDDGIVVPNSVPAVQQFDGTINSQGVATSYGVDVDQYDISGLLTPGQTSGTTQYSAGADLVLLMAQVVSATSDPAVDLTVSMTQTGPFVSGGTGAYDITVSNAAGMEREDNTVTVTDTLPAGLTYNSASGTGWSCSAAGQVVTCTHPAPLNAGASFPVLTITVNVAELAAPSVTNNITVSTPSYELITNNNSASIVTPTIDPDLSTSTKTVVDLNGGEVAPGDTLRYTVTLTESAGGTAVNTVMTDDVPANSAFGGFVSIPAGAASAFTPAPAGANGNGLITVSGITVPSSSSVTVVFDVTVPAGTMPGANIDNEATVTNPNGPDAAPVAPQLVVTPSLVPATGIKFIYLRQLGGVPSLSRNVPAAIDENEAIAAGTTDSWTLTPALQQAISIPAGDIPVHLWLTRSGAGNNRNLTVTLTSSSGFSTSITTTVNIGSTTIPTDEPVILPNTLARNFPAGTTFTLSVRNNSGNTVTLWHEGNGGAGNNSRFEINSNVVINVDSVQTWNAAYNGGVQQGNYFPGATVFVRAQISDPFGSFDIGAATITITNPAGTDVVLNQPMTAQGAPATCNSTTAASCVYQYAYALPASPVLGTWTARVTGREGTENTVNDFGLTTFVVSIPLPSLTILKISRVISDPVSISNPKRIPQSVVEYEIQATNSGPGTVDANTMVITDAIPANAVMYVATTLGNPVTFANGATPSGLTYNYATNVTYSAVGPAGPWTHAPAPDANGFDPAVRAVRIAPGGTMNAAGGGNPSFTIQFRVRIN